MSMKLIAAVTFIFAVQLGGCAAMSSGEPDDNVATTFSAPEALIAHDFVNALRQLESLAPEQTTVDLPGASRADAFTQEMQNALGAAGYATRWVRQAGSSSLFQYHKTIENAAASTSSEVYELSIGTVEMRRGYATDGARRVRPVTALFVRGADAGSITLNDDIFDNGIVRDNPVQSTSNYDVGEKPAAMDSSSLAFTSAQTSTRSAQNQGLQIASSSIMPDEASPLDPVIRRATSANQLSLPLINRLRAKNVFELGESNFENVLASHIRVTQQVLTFGNDSMRLGRVNKQLLEQMVNRFNPDTDVFLVIGCSMGPTRVGGGNAALALGRAGRVAEALRFAGVDNKYILDEGCWAGDNALDDLPSRGVVVSLNRQSNVMTQ